MVARVHALCALLRVRAVGHELGRGDGADLSYWRGGRFVRCRLSRRWACWGNMVMRVRAPAVAVLFGHYCLCSWKRKWPAERRFLWRACWNIARRRAKTNFHRCFCGVKPFGLYGKGIFCLFVNAEDVRKLANMRAATGSRSSIKSVPKGKSTGLPSV